MSIVFVSVMFRKLYNLRKNYLETLICIVSKRFYFFKSKLQLILKKKRKKQRKNFILDLQMSNHFQRTYTLNSRIVEIRLQDALMKKNSSVRNCLPCETASMRSKKYELYSMWIPLVYILQKRSVCSKIFLIISNGFCFRESFEWWRKSPISRNDTLLSLVAYSTNDVKVDMKR